MKKIFFALALVLLPPAAWAGGCGCGSINAMLTSSRTQTIQAINAHTAAEAQAILNNVMIT